MANQFSTTRMSSKGQVVIPEAIRVQMGLESGAQFMVLAENDIVVLKTVTPPPREEFKHVLQKVRKQAKAVGLDKDELAKAIKTVRNKAKHKK